MPRAAAGSAIIRASWPPPMTATVGASVEGGRDTQRPYPAPSAGRTTDRHRLQVTEPAHRPSRQHPCLVEVLGQPLRSVGVDDHAVAAGPPPPPRGGGDRT